MRPAADDDFVILIAKLDTCGFDKMSLILIYNYHCNHKQRVEINNSFSSWKKNLFGLP